MRIIRNYILQELLGPFFLALTIFTFVLLVGNLVKLTDLVINKGVNILSVGQLFLYMIPYLLSFSVPMAISTAALLAFGRLSSDNEITAMRANGIPLLQIIAPVIVVAAFLSLCLVPLNDKVLPRAHYSFRVLLRDIGIKQPTAYMQAGTFIKNFKDYIIFIYSIKKNEMKNIRIYQPRDNKPTRIIVAEKGRFVPQPGKSMIKLQLQNGSSSEPNPNDPSKMYTLHFQSYNMILDLDKSEVAGKLGKKDKELSIAELKEEIKEHNEKGIDIAPLKTQIHKKICTAFSPLAFVLIGLPLAIRTSRSERSIGFGISLLVIIAYWGLIAGAEAIALQNFIPPAIAMWIPNFILFAIGLILIYKLSRK